MLRGKLKTTLTENKQSDNLNKSQLSFSHGVDEGGVVVDKDDYE
jgi:hypothetical protein